MSVQVEVTAADEELGLPELVIVSTTNNPVRRLCFSPQEWREFLHGVQAGEFDFGLTAEPGDRA